MTLQEGRIVGLYIATNGVKPTLGFRERAPMKPLDNVMAIAGLGLVGDRYFIDTKTGSYSGTSRIPDSKRQVTFAGIESFNTGLREMSGNLPIERFRRNIITTGIDWQETTGKTVSVLTTASEQSAKFLVGEECTPCNIPDDGKLGFKQAMSKEWRGGIRAEVTETGLIAVGFVVLVF